MILIYINIYVSTSYEHTKGTLPFSTNQDPAHAPLAPQSDSLDL